MTIQSRLRGAIFALGIFVAVLAVLELAARLLENTLISRSRPVPTQPGWQTEFFGSLFDWHEPDPHLLWRFKAGLRNSLITTNADHFLGDDIPKEKQADEYRILILGDSSPVGLGLKSHRQTFGELLRYALEKYWGERKRVEIVNTAVSGYSSEQIARQLELTGWDYHPDIVILYCGNNDASVSGIYSDRELLALEKFVGVRSALSRSALYRIMRSFLVKRPTEIADPNRLVVRVSPTLRRKPSINDRSMPESSHAIHHLQTARTASLAGRFAIQALFACERRRRRTASAAADGGYFGKKAGLLSGRKSDAPNPWQL